MKKQLSKYYPLILSLLLFVISLILLSSAMRSGLPYSFFMLFLSALLLFLAITLFLFSRYFKTMQKEKAELFSILDSHQQEIKSTMLLHLCYGTDYNQDNLTKVISFFHLEQRLQHVSIALIQIPVSTKYATAFHKDTYHKLQNEILQICQSISDKFFPAFWMWENPDTLIGVVEISKDLSDNMQLLGLHNLGTELQDSFGEITDKTPVIALGSITATMEQIHQSYSEASELLNHKLHNHLTTPYAYDEFQRTELQFDYNKQQLLARYIRLGKGTEAISFLNSYFSVIHANPHTSVAYVKEITEQILNLISSLSEEMPVVHANCASLLARAEQQLDTLTHVHDFGQFLLPLVQEVCNCVIAVSANKGKLKIDKLTAWINENYAQDLSLETMAEYIGCSPAYTSKLFKKETNYDIITYLSRIRIQHAKELLSTTRMTLDEISASVGYNHLQTFIRNFKKLTGLTPTEYRNTSDTAEKKQDGH